MDGWMFLSTQSTLGCSSVGLDSNWPISLTWTGLSLPEKGQMRDVCFQQQTSSSLEAKARQRGCLAPGDGVGGGASFTSVGCRFKLCYGTAVDREISTTHWGQMKREKSLPTHNKFTVNCSPSVKHPIEGRQEVVWMDISYRLITGYFHYDLCFSAYWRLWYFKDSKTQAVFLDLQIASKVRREKTSVFLPVGAAETQAVNIMTERASVENSIHHPLRNVAIWVQQLQSTPI